MSIDDLVVDPKLLRRFDRPGPRYTSYPTADRFVDAYDARTHRRTLEAHRVQAARRGLSLYVHLPFCEHACYCCSCNMVVTRDHRRSSRYLRYLERELDLVTEVVGRSQRVEQLHWGGGTPTFLDADEMGALMALLRSRFDFVEGCEYSIEVDPRTVDAAKMDAIGALGFNRISLGVQDFDPAVQQAINRMQSFEQTRAVVEQARHLGCKSVNVDLIYGLPRQTPERFAATLDQVLVLKPKRIALYGYTHLPALYKPQRHILESELPDAGVRIRLLQGAMRKLTDAGYQYIGMDHFARPDDDLVKAQQLGHLHRDFQGYSTRPECDLLGIGVSAISAIGSTYSQNARTLDGYYDRLDQGRLPVARGLELSADDLLRRTVIQSLMCSFELSIESIEQTYLVEFGRTFAVELEALREYIALGLVEIDSEWLNVTPRGRLFVRAIAMLFDRYLRESEMRARHAGVV